MTGIEGGSAGGRSSRAAGGHLTSWGSAPFSVGRLSLGELQPDTGVLLLLGEESVGTGAGRQIATETHNRGRRESQGTIMHERGCVLTEIGREVRTRQVWATRGGKNT